MVCWVRVLLMVVYVSVEGVAGTDTQDSLSLAYFNLLDCPEIQRTKRGNVHSVEQQDNTTMLEFYNAITCGDLNKWLMLTKAPKPRDCEDILRATAGNATDGVYKIYPKGARGFWVYCDMTTAGGGWTVFQRRMNGEVDFYRNWKDYSKGFGMLNGEFWLGNNKIHGIVSQGFYKLRVALEDFSDVKRYAEYNTFNVASEGQKYTLTVGGYSGNAGDSMSYHSGNQFSARDQDNDKLNSFCSNLYKGGFWYNSCHQANPNGLYLGGDDRQYGVGINWNAWHGYHVSLKGTIMMARKQ